MVRYLTERLPMMVCPRWVNTRVQPLALGDLLAYLSEAMHVTPGVYDVGSPDVTTYREMMDTYARVRGLRRRFIVKVPVLSPALSAHWVDLVTPVDQTVSHALIESLANEVTVRHRERTDAAFTVRPLRIGSGHPGRPRRPGRPDGRHPLRPEPGTGGGGLHRPVLGPGAPRRHLGRRRRGRGGGRPGRLRGQLTWYGWPYAWQLRIALGHLFDEDLRLGRPGRVEEGATVDWWTVEVREPQTLVLSTRTWFCGEAWLGFRVSSTHPVRIEQVGSLRTAGLLGMAYWWLLWPIHQIAFRAMVHHRVVRARRMARRMARHR